MEKLKTLEALKRHEPSSAMTGKEAQILMNLLLSKDINLSVALCDIDKESKTYKHFEPLINSQRALLFLNRLSKLKIHRITLSALIILLLYIDDTNSANVYSLYIHSKLPEYTVIDLSVISEKLFPMGFFSQEQLINISETKFRKLELAN
jgi:hypothetical protein